MLRTTQFHEFAEQSLGYSAVGPVSFVPSMRIQPVAAAEVAETSIDLFEAGPAGRATDLAAPEEHTSSTWSVRLRPPGPPAERVDE